VVVAQPVGSQRVQVGCLDRAAVAAEMAEPGVVEDDEQDVRRAFAGAVGRGPRGLGHIERPADDAGKGLARLVFLERHGVLLSRSPGSGQAPDRSGFLRSTASPKRRQAGLRTTVSPYRLPGSKSQ